MTVGGNVALDCVLGFIIFRCRIHYRASSVYCQLAATVLIHRRHTYSVHINLYSADNRENESVALAQDD